jgi:A/G-specific adenine glycosylase
MSHAELAAIRGRLLSWYKTHKRDLPWRRTADPYAIWISETMLQQTQVSTVIPYYERFITAFPSITALDRAPLARVLALWSGLGYYRRAENLKKAARIVAEHHGGRLPADLKSLRTLPGIGEYTAGAILSIAFGKPYPAVDGNARRVLGRLLPHSDENSLRAAALKLIGKSDPGQFNQSLMELGSLLCTPQKPRCAECPIASLCPTHGCRAQARPKGPSARMRSVTWPLTIVRDRGKLLLRRRASNGILAGLWELPGGEDADHQNLGAIFGADLPRIRKLAIKRLGVIAHSITNRRIRAPVFLVEWRAGAKHRFKKPGWRWIPVGALDGYATSSMTRKAFRLLSEYEKSHLQ